MSSQPFDDTTKAFYRQFFEQQGIRALPQFEVFTRSRAIDLVVQCTPADQAKLQPTVFQHFRQLNSIEFKGVHDPLSAVDFNRIMMRAWGLGALDTSKQDEADKPPFSPAEIAKNPDQRTVNIISVTEPVQILKTLKKKFHFAPTKRAGVYVNQPAGQLAVWIIHPGSLTIEPANYPLLALARGEKLRQFIDLCLREGLVDYLQLVLDIGLLTDPDLIWRKMMEVLKMPITLREDTWPYIDQFFREMPEALQKMPTFQEALTESLKIGEQRGIQIGEEKGIQIGEEKGRKIGEQRGREQGIQIGMERGEQRGIQVGQVKGQKEGLRLGKVQTLLQLLRLRFGDLPDDIVQRIEDTQDTNRLDEWINQVLFISSLAELKS